MSKKSAKAATEEPTTAQGLLGAPIVPRNALHKGTTRSRTFRGWLMDDDLERVTDPVRLESNVRAVRFAPATSKTDKLEFRHDAGEDPVAVCISGVKIPGAVIKDAADISIDVFSADDSSIVLSVTPADKGIAVGITAMFQSAGLASTAKA